MPPPVARDQLRRLVVALEAGQPAPADVAAWFAKGAEAFLQGEGTLCRTLELRGNGQRLAATHAALERRDRYLREAARHLALDPAVTAWERAKRLEQAIRRFNPKKEWPTDPLQLNLWRASVTAKIPTSARALYDVLK